MRLPWCERELLLKHAIVVLQFPFYWYGTPAILKEWQDETLAFGFAYGPGGDKLQGKSLLVAMTTGGPAETYRHDGYNRYTFDELLTPLQAMANLTGMRWLPPFVSDGVLRQSPEQSAINACAYRQRIVELSGE